MHEKNRLKSSDQLTVEKICLLYMKDSISWIWLQSEDSGDWVRNYLNRNVPVNRIQISKINRYDNQDRGPSRWITCKGIFKRKKIETTLKLCHTNPKTVNLIFVILVMMTRHATAVYNDITVVHNDNNKSDFIDKQKVTDVTVPNTPASLIDEHSTCFITNSEIATKFILNARSHKHLNKINYYPDCE